MIPNSIYSSDNDHYHKNTQQITDMTPEITFTNAQISDLAFIVNVYNQTIPSRMVTADTNPITVDSKMAWFAAHNPQTRPLWLISYQGKACGWVSLSTFYGRPAYDSTVEISLYLHQDYRGKKIGQHTVKHLETFAKKNGIEAILCYIFGHNQPSLYLFEKMGYQKWGHLPNIAKLDDIKRDLIILGKNL